jgi:hypothetical protein
VEIHSSKKQGAQMSYVCHAFRKSRTNGLGNVASTGDAISVAVMETELGIKWS